MSPLSQRVTSNGLRLPRELLEQWGAQQGQALLIDVDRECIRISRADLQEAEIADRAATHVFDHVGDAAAVGKPQREGESWRVPVTLSYRTQTLGILMYSAAGELISAESDSPATLRQRAREA